MSVLIVVICEDKQTEVFIRRFLKQRNFTNHDFRFETCPKGKQSGEQWVRVRYPNELEAYRTRRAKADSRLIVATDADTLSVNDRVRSLDTVCEREKVSVRQADERVMFMIPKRNIESWFAYLRDEDVDEETVYKKYQYESECQKDVEALDRMCRDGELRSSPPSSLQHTCSEFPRLGI